MSDHLPECWYYDPAKTPAVAVNDGWPCICNRLCACEQRVLDAAREAVNGLPVYDDHGALKPFKPETAVIYAMDALAAIDALKEKP